MHGWCPHGRLASLGDGMWTRVEGVWEGPISPMWPLYIVFGKGATIKASLGFPKRRLHQSKLSYVGLTFIRKFVLLGI